MTAVEPVLPDPVAPAPLPADAVTVELTVGGMTCGACSARVERMLRKIDGVDAAVNYATGRALVTLTAPVPTDQLVATVVKAGYTAEPVLPAPPEPADDDAGESPRDTALAALRDRLQICLALSLPVIALAMVPAWQFAGWQWLSLALAAPVVAWGALPFHRKALANLRHRTATMDTLVSVGTIAAFGWSLYALVFGTAGTIGLSHPFSLALTRSHGTSHVYLEVAAGVTTFVLAGRYAEARARRRSGAALEALLGLAAKDAAVRRDGREVRVAAADLVVGDVVVVRPGEKIATDGVVVEGASAVDTSTVTGEPVPAEVGIGDAVLGGCVNVGGALVVRATRVGSETQLAQIAALVEQAQTGKAQVQRLADRVSGVFVPVVLTLAALTFLAWFVLGGDAATAFAAATAVLVVACPCALGLATPTALLVGTGRGAQCGILVRGPEVLESTRRVDTVVLDKTGTVTAGAMTVVDVVPAPGVDADEVLAVAGALEAATAHPIARAVAAHAETRVGPPAAVADLTALDGLGVRGVVDGVTALVGRTRLMEEHGVVVGAELAAAVDAAQREGRTAVLVAWSGRARAMIAVADTVRPTSAAAVGALRRLGLDPVLCSGDHATAVDAVARAVGIETVVAEALPVDKVEAVRRLQARGRTVAVVGDGVNDAAALAAADLGIAIGTGADAAIHAADLTLVRADLETAVDAIRLARRTLGTIQGNLFWAFAYNVLALPLAALGFLNPMLAGALMASSSVFVVTNSLRLRRFRPGVR